MYKTKKINIEKLRELISYEETTGFLYWNYREPKSDDDHATKCFNKRRAGKRIDSKPFNNGNGNLYMRVKVLGEVFLYHRLCWALATGEQPEMIDHINGDSTDNRLCNLRNVNAKENNRNMRMNKLNTTGYMGVNVNSLDRSKWNAYIWINNKQINLGIFDTKPEAVAARKAAEKVENYHKNHGKRS